MCESSRPRRISAAWEHEQDRSRLEGEADRRVQPNHWGSVDIWMCSYTWLTCSRIIRNSVGCPKVIPLVSSWFQNSWCMNLNSFSWLVCLFYRWLSFVSTLCTYWPSLSLVHLSWQAFCIACFFKAWDSTLGQSTPIWLKFVCWGIMMLRSGMRQ